MKYFLIALAAVLPVAAHHSFAMFDMGKDVTYEGIVQEYRWENPHSHIIVKIENGPNAGTWDIEGGSTAIMGRQGWSRATYKFGDKATIVGHPMRDGSKGVSLFYAVMPDGKRLYHDIARPKSESAEAK
jgi:hypothetical protein